jgi:ubiquinone/menaquinone biosynthesis C-methylase UbiE
VRSRGVKYKIGPVHKLSDEQLRAFNRDRITESKWRPLQACITKDFPDGQFTFLDIGGGNGTFADRILASYPESRATVLDNSEMLLAHNIQSDRKRVIRADAACLQGHGYTYDIVFCNWLLHHLVTTGSYPETISNIRSVLQSCRRLINQGGRLSVFENDYEGWIDNFPGRAIFEVTSLKIIAPLTKRLGANTAGVGVAFHSSRKWKDLLDSAGWTLISHTQDTDIRELPLYAKACFLIKKAPSGHYWLASRR